MIRCSGLQRLTASYALPLHDALRWVLNTVQSDDAEKMLMERLEEQRARDRKLMERYQRSRRADLSPLGEEGVDMPAATRDALR
jgi:hypothetical protein